MNGPFAFNQTEVNKLNDTAGAYILGISKNDGKNYAIYVGRSDGGQNAGLKTRLTQHLINEDNDLLKKNPPTLFWYQYCQSAEEAYKLECTWYHQYNPSCNNVHPAKASSSWICPVCRN